MTEKSMTADSIKSFLEAHLTSLHGRIMGLEIDELEGIPRGYKIKGKYTIPWGKMYSFEMKMDDGGAMTAYKREEKQ